MLLEFQLITSTLTLFRLKVFFEYFSIILTSFIFAYIFSGREIISDEVLGRDHQIYLTGINVAANANSVYDAIIQFGEATGAIEPGMAFFSYVMNFLGAQPRDILFIYLCISISLLMLGFKKFYAHCQVKYYYLFVTTVTFVAYFGSIYRQALPLALFSISSRYAIQGCAKSKYFFLTIIGSLFHVSFIIPSVLLYLISIKIKLKIYHYIFLSLAFLMAASLYQDKIIAASEQGFEGFSWALQGFLELLVMLFIFKLFKNKSSESVSIIINFCIYIYLCSIVLIPFGHMGHRLFRYFYIVFPIFISYIYIPRYFVLKTRFLIFIIFTVYSILLYNYRYYEIFE